MAKSNPAGRLTVFFNADTKGFDSGMQRAEQRLGRTSRRMSETNRSTGRLNQRLTEGARAFDDFFAVVGQQGFTLQGISAGMRGAQNNITAILATTNPIIAGITGVSIALGSLLIPKLFGTAEAAELAGNKMKDLGQDTRAAIDRFRVAQGLQPAYRGSGVQGANVPDELAPLHNQREEIRGLIRARRAELRRSRGIGEQGGFGLGGALAGFGRGLPGALPKDAELDALVSRAQSTQAQIEILGGARLRAQQEVVVKRAAEFVEGIFEPTRARALAKMFAEGFRKNVLEPLEKQQQIVRNRILRIQTALDSKVGRAAGAFLANPLGEIAKAGVNRLFGGGTGADTNRFAAAISPDAPGAAAAQIRGRLANQTATDAKRTADNTDIITGFLSRIVNRVEQQVQIGILNPQG